MIKEFKTKNASGTYNAGRDVEKEVFKRVIEFFKEHECFSGECMHQCDGPQLAAPEFLSDLLDDVLKFEVNFGDE